MSDASDRRNAKARAAGFSSYGQQYRAQKAGYTSAAAYQAAVNAKRQAFGQSSAAGRLLGGAHTAAGRVVWARWSVPGAMSAMWQIIRRQSPGKVAHHWSAALGRVVTTTEGGKHVGIDVETVDGTVYHLGQKRGGYSITYLRQLVHDHGTWKGAVMELLSQVYGYESGDAGGQPAVVTVTIR